MVMKVTVDPDEKFRKEISKAVKGVKDLTIPLKSISRRWYQSNKSIFALKGPGMYEDLSPKYKARKERSIGFTYPILLGKHGRIKDAITNPSNSNAVAYIVNKKILVLGVEKNRDFPYPMAHHYGNPLKNLPSRPFLFTGAEQIRPKGHEKARQIYIKIIRDYVLQRSKGIGV